MADSIWIKRELWSYEAIEKFARRRGYEWYQPVMEPQWVAWLIEILKQSEDIPELFPHGKWATIQRLQNLLCAAAAGDRFKSVQAPEGENL